MIDTIGEDAEQTADKVRLGLWQYPTFDAEVHSAALRGWESCGVWGRYWELIVGLFV